MNKYLADTTVVVDMLRGDVLAKRFLEKKPEISLVTVAELIQGSRDKENLKIVDKTCRLLPLVSVDAKVSARAIELLHQYNLSHGLLFLDALVAASALVRNRILVTANAKDFKSIEGLKVVLQRDILAKEQNI